MLKTIPIAFHPTTIVAIDDDRQFLELMKLRFGKMRSFKLFDSPSVGVDYLFYDYRGKKVFANFLQRNAKQGYHVDVAVDNVYQIAYDPSRFACHSVIILDYAMPGMTGADVALQLRDLGVKIILLTGEASVSSAIDLFNQDLIHRYISKDDSDLPEQLGQSIDELEQQFFIEQSQIILQSISEQFFTDPLFVGFFERLIEQHKIIEYYYVPAHSGFLCLDVDSKASFMKITDHEHDETARLVRGNINYYVSVAPLTPEHDFIKADKLISYHDFLDK